LNSSQNCGRAHRLGEHLNDGGFRFSWLLTHEEIASMAFTTRETVTRTLGQFRKNGCISIEDSMLAIHQPEHLAAQVDNRLQALNSFFVLRDFRSRLPRLRSQRVYDGKQEFLLHHGTFCSFVLCCSSLLLRCYQPNPGPGPAACDLDGFTRGAAVSKN
jgi:hypothetical protein